MLIKDRALFSHRISAAEQRYNGFGERYDGRRYYV